MNRRDAIKMLAASGFLAARPGLGDDPKQGEMVRRLGEMMRTIPITATTLTGSLSMLQGPGGNMGVLAGPDGTILIDSGFPGRGEEIAAKAQAVGGKPIATLINTHWHIDHAGGNAAVGKLGAKIVATAATKKRLSTDQFTEAFQMTTPATPPIGLPTQTVEEAEIRVGDETLHLVPVPPAHTDGDLFVHFRKADVIHCGDLVSFGVFPNIDYSSKGWLGGMVAAADILLKMAGPNTKIIPGHGPLGRKADLSAYRTMLGVIYDRVAPMVDAGKTADQVVAAMPTKDYDATLGKGFLNPGAFTKLVYAGIVRHKDGGSK